MNNKRKVPRILLGAAASGSGKTLLTCGLLQALKNRNLQVASFKCGPDYIDPMFHSRVIGTKSRNLDSFFAKEDTLRYLLEKNARDCEISVIEGVMGYYDGLAGISPKASAYDVARITNTPAVLIVNAKGMSLSAAAFVKGFVEYREDSQIRGVILNQISPMMYPRLKQIIEETLPVKVYGYVPVVKDCVLESRHLGLVMPEEIADLHDKLMKLAEILEKSVDIDGLLELAEGADEIPVEEPLTGYHTKRTVRIALAKDEAFCFFYQDNLELLEEMGAQLIPFSPIHDEKLPENIDGMLFHGGYPELYAKALSENKKMLTSVREAVQAGIPYMAECGGFMYLHQEMEDMEGHSWPMAGVIPGKSWRTPRLTRFGYITLEDGTCFGKNVGGIRAHEFHYFDSDNCGESYTARKPLSSRSWNCIHSDRQGMSGFPHMYYYSNLQVPEQFLRTCEERKA